MNFIRKWNKAFFTAKFNVFDMLMCAIIWPFASTVNIFWLLLLIPAILFSSFMETLVRHAEEV
jgi:hypothetical protein